LTVSGRCFTDRRARTGRGTRHGSRCRRHGIEPRDSPVRVPSARRCWYCQHLAGDGPGADDGDGRRGNGGKTMATRTERRRPERAAFLRSRRARVTPADVGMPPGLRRRTPGLRREEVAQLSGVGVTWYTWLEQGRPINASAQVLDAVARTLRLDPAEHHHLYTLAQVPGVTKAEAPVCHMPPEIQQILD